MPLTALIPPPSQCRTCGHPIRWTYAYVAAPDTQQGMSASRLEKTVLPRCPGGCGQTVSDHHDPCDSCWDRLPTELKRGLLLSLTGLDINAARINVAAYLHANPGQTRNLTERTNES